MANADDTPQPSTRAGWPLIAIISLVVLSFVLISTLLIALSSYISSRSTIEDIWVSLGRSLSAGSMQETLRYLEPAEPFAEITSELLTSGELEPSREPLFDYFEAALDAHPFFTWIAWSTPQGDYYSVYRWPTDDGTVEVRRTHRHPLGPDSTRLQVWSRADDGWTLTEEQGEGYHYDPRTRPWYQSALADPGQGVWVDPFFFASRQQVGVSHVRSVFHDGALLGVLSIEFEASPLSDFLATLDVSPGGRVYVLDDSGTVLGHPAGEVSRIVGGEAALTRAESHPDPMLSAAWGALQSREGDTRWEPFEHDDLLIMAQPFPRDTGIPWQILTVAPSDEVFGDARAQAQSSLLIAAITTLLLVLLAYLFSRRVTRSIRGLRTELERIAHFELEGQHLDTEPTLVREFNEMVHATQRMKHGLRSFGKYVPHQLVGELLRSGQEAELGGELREMTILFTDIAGFTTIAESIPPQQLLDALGSYLQTMNRSIKDSEGTVCQYLGDAIMAFWGAPRELPDHALKACIGALEMRAGAEEMVERAEQSGAPAFPTRFGINTGTVLVGNVGAPNRFNYAILGDPVNTTARLESLNKVYGTRVLIGERTAELIGDALVTRPIDWVQMKGKNKPLLVYELVGTHDTVPQSHKDNLERYTHALQMYQEKRFLDALEAFKDADARLGGDTASRVLIERCTKYLKAPPGDGWSGIYVAVSK